jgi:hypothetical protein
MSRLFIVLALCAVSAQACSRGAQPASTIPAPIPASVSQPAAATTSMATPASAPVDAAPTSFVRSTSDSRNTQLVELREGLAHATAFRLITDALNQNFTVDVSDARVGFLMTTWQASVLRDGVPDLRYRTRVVIRFAADDPRQVAVRAEANWQHGDEWDVGFDSALLDQVTADLRAKLGKKP